MKKNACYIIFIVLMLAACGGDGGVYIRNYVAVTGISLDRNEVTLNLWSGEEYPDFDKSTATLTALIAPENASIREVVWSSSDANIVKVDQNGLITAVPAGVGAGGIRFVTITARTVDGGKTASSFVRVGNVKPQRITGVALNPSELELKYGHPAITTSGILTVEFDPIFVINDTVHWGSSNPDVVSVVNGRVTSISPGTAVIFATTADGGLIATSRVTVSPLATQYPSIAAFLTRAKNDIVPCTSPHTNDDYFFGSCPEAKGDSASNVAIVENATSSGVTHDLFVIDYSTYDFDLFGRAGKGNLVPRFIPPMLPDGTWARPSSFSAGPYRSNTRSNVSVLAHFVFTGFRQIHPWGSNNSGRAGQMWYVGGGAANANVHQFSGIAVDLGADVEFDTVVVFAGHGSNATNQFTAANCPSISVDFLRSGNADAFRSLTSSLAWDASPTGWPAPGSPPWISAGTIVPNGNSWVYLFRLEEPVLARFIRVSFEQPPVPGNPGLFSGFAGANSIEVYNTRSSFAGFWNE